MSRTYTTTSGNPKDAKKPALLPASFNEVEDIDAVDIAGMPVIYEGPHKDVRATALGAYKDGKRGVRVFLKTENGNTMWAPLDKIEAE